MGHYRKINTRIWNDEKFNALSDPAKLAFLFPLTHPNLTMLGAMRTTIPGLAAERGVPLEGFREAFAEVLSRGMAKHDERASFLWFPNFLRYNRPESPNVVKSWPHAFELLPECQLKNELLQHSKDFVEGLTEGFAKAFRQAFSDDFAKTMPNQEQEQEQDNTGAGDIISPQMVAQGVLLELGLSGKYLPGVIRDVVLAEFKRGRTADQVKDEMVASRRDYEKNVGKLKWPLNVEKFFGEGNWRNRSGWPWKEDMVPSSTNESPKVPNDKPVFEHRSTAVSLKDIRATVALEVQ
jgi:hypothetical protein